MVARSLPPPRPLGGDSEPQPDIAIVRKASYAAAHPDRAMLIVEVADSSLEHDRDTKGPLYAAAGVPEYWLIDVVGQAVEVYREPRDGRYANRRRADLSGTVAVAAYPEVVIGVRDLSVVRAFAVLGHDRVAHYLPESLKAPALLPASTRCAPNRRLDVEGRVVKGKRVGVRRGRRLGALARAKRDTARGEIGSAGRKRDDSRRLPAMLLTTVGLHWEGGARREVT
jgi:hypothetical protein